MSDQDVINTIIAEAAGEGNAGMAAVASVIRNRANQYGLEPSSVVKQSGQFTGYTHPGPAARQAQQNPSVRANAERIWNAVNNGTIADPTNGGTYYHASSVTPYWADDVNKHGSVKIGNQVFYKGSGSPSSVLSAINTAVPQAMPSSVASGYAAPNVPTPRPRPASTGTRTMDYSGLNWQPATGGSYNPFDQLPSGFNPNGAPLTSRSVNTVPIDPSTGNPMSGQQMAQQAANEAAERMRQQLAARVASSFPSRPSGPPSGLPAYAPNSYGQPPTTVAQTQSEQSMGRGYAPSGAIRTTTAQAGQIPMPPGARPSSIDQMFADMTNQAPRLPQGQPGMPFSSQPDITGVRSYSGTDVPPMGTPSSIPLAPMPMQRPGGFSQSPLMAYGDVPNPLPAPPPLQAINAATAGPMAPTPMARPLSLSAVPAAPPMPRARPTTGVPLSGPSYQVRSGDTLSQIARSLGVTTGQLASANGISNPNRIQAGQHLNLSFLAGPAPQQRPVALGGPGNPQGGGNSFGGASHWDNASGGFVYS
jgi:hypothetical protein